MNITISKVMVQETFTRYQNSDKAFLINFDCFRVLLYRFLKILEN